MLFFWTLFIKESRKIKCITVSTKIWSSTTVFSIDTNQKCFLSINSVYYYDFWRSCDTEDWINDAGNTAAHHRNKLQFKLYSNRNYFFKIVIIFHNTTVFTVVLVNLMQLKIIYKNKSCWPCWHKMHKRKKKLMRLNCNANATLEISYKYLSLFVQTLNIFPLILNWLLMSSYYW